MKINWFKIISLPLLMLIFVTVSNAQATNESKKDKETAEKQTKSKDEEDCPRNGVVRLKATFHKSGKVTKVEVVDSSGCKPFDERAIEAAKKMKFEPKIENGKPVTVKKLIEYSFSTEN